MKRYPAVLSIPAAMLNLLAIFTAHAQSTQAASVMIRFLYDTCGGRKK